MIALVPLAATAHAAAPRVPLFDFLIHRDEERAAGPLDLNAPARGKGHGTINSDRGLPDDKPTQAWFEFLDEALKT